MAGSGAIGTGGGSSVCHEAHDFGRVMLMLAKGLEEFSARSKSLGCDLAGAEDRKEGSERSPSPALQRAILVPSLLSMAMGFEVNGKSRTEKRRNHIELHCRKRQMSGFWHLC